MFEPPSVAIDDIQSIHMIGVGGSGMSGLAKLLAQRGVSVTGSDLKPSAVIDSLSGVGVETWIGHRPDRMVAADVVVASSAVPDQDAELSAARNAGVATARRPALLRGVTMAFSTIGFSGTHGKTSSTAMAVAALRACGRDPSFIVGGELTDLNTGAHLGDRDVLVLEADEAFGTFRHLELEALGVTNIEADHLDYYKTVTALEEAFAQVAGRTTGPVVGCIDDPGVRRLAERATVIGYGTGPGARLAASATSSWERSHRSHCTGRGETHRVRIRQPGQHVVTNAAGVLALLGELEFDLPCAIDGLEQFGGVRRRFEVMAHIGGVSIVDDYAHHPTEVGSTVEAARTMTDGPPLDRLPAASLHQNRRPRPRVRRTARSGRPHRRHRRVRSGGAAATGCVPAGWSQRRFEPSAADVDYVQRLADVPERPRRAARVGRYGGAHGRR